MFEYIGHLCPTDPYNILAYEVQLRRDSAEDMYWLHCAKAYGRVNDDLGEVAQVLPTPTKAIVEAGTGDNGCAVATDGQESQEAHSRLRRLHNAAD